MSTAPPKNQSIFDQASSQVAQELAAQSAPIQQQIGDVTADQGQANKQLTSMFGSILPASASAADHLTEDYQQSLLAQQSMYTAANQRLNQLAQQRAQEAQTLSQQIGGPVAVGDFTSQVTPDQQYLAAAGASDTMNLLGQQAAGVQQARTFAGTVMPLIQTESQAASDRYFQQKKSDLQNQIDTLNAGKSTLTNQRYSDLLQQATQNKLQTSQLALDRLKANRDWKATLRTLGQEDKRVKLAQQDASRADAALTGKFKGKPTMAAKDLAARIKSMSVQDKQAAAQLGLSNREFALRQRQADQAGQLAAQGALLRTRQYAMSLVDAITGTGTKNVSQTVTTEVTRNTGLINKKAYSINKTVPKGTPGATLQPDGSYAVKHYYLDRTITEPVTGKGSRNPQDIYNYLVDGGVGGPLALKLVRDKLHLPNWKPSGK